MKLFSLQNQQLLKQTTSRCPVCHAACPAEVWNIDKKVFLKRRCATHGGFSACIASDSRFYWLAKGDPKNSCCGGSSCCSAENISFGTIGRNALAEKGAAFEKLSTCLALIEIVNSCNLACPTCYANSPVGTGAKVDAVPLENLQQRIQGIIDRKGKIEILQFSGGEPTLHPQFFELLEWAKENPGIDYLLLNTNGVRIANEPDFAKRLGEIFARGGLQLYLQFDGVQAESQHFLRGADLRATRQRCIESCAEANLPITLAMTVTPENLPFVWDAIEFGLRHPHIHGITFQPMFGSGRTPVQTGRADLQVGPDAPQRIPTKEKLNTADIILSAVEHSRSKLRFEDFTPLPCGDPNCATIGYLIRANDRVHSISDFIDFTQLQDFLKDKVHYTLEDLARCGCENEPLGELLKKLELKSSMAFRIMIKPFMDAWSWDEDRIDRCCTHVIRPDGKLDSFCRYYSGFADVTTNA